MDNKLIEQYKNDLIKMYRMSANSRNSGSSYSPMNRMTQQNMQNAVSDNENRIYQAEAEAPRNPQGTPSGMMNNPAVNSPTVNTPASSSADTQFPIMRRQNTQTNQSTQTNPGTSFSRNQSIIQGTQTNQATTMPQSTPARQGTSQTSPNQNIGRLIAIATTVNDLYPVPNAKVTIFTGPYESMNVIATAYTDENGRTTPFELVAPPKELSQTPGLTQKPYAEYNMLVEADGYLNNIHLKIPVFEGVTSLQRSNMVLVSAGGSQGGPLIFDASAPRDL